MLSGKSPIIPESKFVQIRLQVFPIHAPVMSALQPSLEVADDAVNPWEDYSCTRFVSLDLRIVPVAKILQTSIALPSVGVYFGARCDMLTDEGVQGSPGSIRHDLQSNPPSMIPPIFDCNSHNGLAYTAPSWLLSPTSSDEGFIDLDNSL